MMLESLMILECLLYATPWKKSYDQPRQHIWRRQWHPTPVLLPGKSHGRRSLVRRLQSLGSLRVRHNWVTSLSLFTFMHWRRKWQPTPVFLPGESQGRGTWWAAVYGVAQSQTRLKWLSSSSRQHIQKQRHYFANKGPCSQSYGFSSSHVWMWELDHEESWARKNWCFWTVVLEKTLRVAWTARRSNQSILKEISPEYSSSGLMLKLKLQYFSHLMQRTDSLEKALMLGKIEGGRRGGWKMVGWHH